MTANQGMGLGIFLLLFTAAALWFKPVEEPVSNTPAKQELGATRPERLRYVVWVHDCQALSGALLTDSEGPPIWLPAKQPLSFSDELVILDAVINDRYTIVDTCNVDFSPQDFKS